MFITNRIFEKEYTVLNTFSANFGWEILKLEQQEDNVVVEFFEGKYEDAGESMDKIRVLTCTKVSKFRKTEKTGNNSTSVSKWFMSDVVHVVMTGNDFSADFLCKDISISQSHFRDNQSRQEIIPVDHLPAMNSYADFLDRYLALGWEKNEKMKERFKEFSWQLDIKEHTVAINDYKLQAQILGTFDISEGTWLWSYANRNSPIPSAMEKDARLLQVYGEKYEIEFFKNEKFETTKEEMLAMIAACSAFLKRAAYFVSKQDDVLVFYTIDSGEELFDPTSTRHFTFSVERAAKHPLVNHRKAFNYFLEAKGYSVQETQGKSLAAKDAHTIMATFDENEKLLKIGSE